MKLSRRRDSQVCIDERTCNLPGFRGLRLLELSISDIPIPQARLPVLFFIRNITVYPLFVGEPSCVYDLGIGRQARTERLEYLLIDT